MSEFYWMDRGCEKLTAYDGWNLDTVLVAQDRRDGGDSIQEEVEELN
jgi:hypothetical protein